MFSSENGEAAARFADFCDGSLMLLAYTITGVLAMTVLFNTRAPILQ